MADPSAAMRGIAPRPRRTRGDRELIHGGSASANISGSSSNGSRFGSTNTLGNRAASTGAPKAGAPETSSSTQLSSERRKASFPTAAPARNAASYSRPLCGEATTTGSVRTAGRKSATGEASNAGGGGMAEERRWTDERRRNGRTL